ncbi:MAG: hypothetical protein JXB60_04315 [Candidatus Cloacimonetes bacterium]|nr:hypothetical protein [Candidatus Cloacimonadota bacterium]
MSHSVFIVGAGVYYRQELFNSGKADCRVTGGENEKKPDAAFPDDSFGTI